MKEQIFYKKIYLDWSLLMYVYFENIENDKQTTIWKLL
jgi:hypothetical protein